MRKFSYYIFLLPLFFVLHAINEHYGLIPFDVAARFLAYYLILSLALLLIGTFIFKSREKGGIWAFSLLLVFFFFGAAHDFLKELRIPRLFISYSFILPLLLILFILSTILIRRKQKFTKSIFFLNILFGLFVLVELVSLVIGIVTNKEKKLRLSGYSSPVVVQLPQITERLKPDIFFIVFDEYASSESLKKYLNFDNADIDSAFLNKGFHIVTASKSNYNETAPSVAATLNMNYHSQPLDGKTQDADLILRSCKEIKLSLVPELLANAGYKIKNLGLFDLHSQPVLTSNFFNSYTKNLIHLQTLWGRIRKDIWWNVEVRLNKNSEREAIQKEVERNIVNFKETIKEIKAKEEGPKFVYTHIMMPHSPFFFSKEGTPLKSLLYKTDPPELNTLYLNQLIYTNTWIREIIDNIPLDRKRPLVIIIQGDHGLRSELPAFTRERQFMNLNTFYFDDNDYKLLYDSMSSVNTFRVIFDKYFHTNLPLLKDSTIFLK